MANDLTNHASEIKPLTFLAGELIDVLEEDAPSSRSVSYLVPTTLGFLELSHLPILL